MPLMPLFDRAAKAAEDQGIEAYWETLATPPRSPLASTTRSRVGPGYADQGHAGTGHASDQIVPLDKMFALK